MARPLRGGTFFFAASLSLSIIESVEEKIIKKFVRHYLFLEGQLPYEPQCWSFRLSVCPKNSMSEI